MHVRISVCMCVCVTKGRLGTLARASYKRGCAHDGVIQYNG